MKKAIKIYVFWLILICNSFSCSGQIQKDTENDDSSWPLEVICDSANISNLIADWKKDSLGCLGIRHQVLADCLTELLQLNGKTQEEIIFWLGIANHTHTKELFLGNLNMRKEFILMDYYFDARCNHEGELLLGSRCWLRIIVDPDKLRVVQVDLGCNE